MSKAESDRWMVVLFGCLDEVDWRHLDVTWGGMKLNGGSRNVIRLLYIFCQKYVEERSNSIFFVQMLFHSNTKPNNQFKQFFVFFCNIFYFFS